MKALVRATVAVFVCGTSVAWGAEKEGPAAPKAAPAVEQKKENATASQAAPAVEQKKEGRDKGREGARLQGQLAEISRICGLSEEQQKKLIEIDDARVKAMKELMAKSLEQIAGCYHNREASRFRLAEARNLYRNNHHHGLCAVVQSILHRFA